MSAEQQVEAKKQFTRSEVRGCNTRQNAVIIIHNRVYNVTDFLNEHPGGEEVLLEKAGEDASEEFDDIGHSIDAKQLMSKYEIGEVTESERSSTKAATKDNQATSNDKKDNCVIS